ncbi:MAG: polysaccharide biosynthesis C-terminal domain-containing protein [Candidatus Omnitrophota bacterium]
MDILKKGFRGVIYQYAGAVFLGIIGFATSAYLIKKLSIEDYGVYNFLFTVIVSLELLTAFGLTQTIQRYLPEYRTKGDNYIQKAIVIRALLIRFIMGLVLVFAVWGFSDRILVVFNMPAQYKEIFIIALGIVMFYIESKILGEGVLSALLENGYYNLAYSAYAVIRLILFYLVVARGVRLGGIVFAWLAAEAALFILLFLKVYRMIIRLPAGTGTKGHFPLRRFAGFGGMAYLSNVAYFFRDKAGDVFLLSYFLGPYAVGLYSFAFGIPLLLMRLSPASMLRAVVTPFMVSRYSETGDKEDLIYYFAFTNRFIFFMMIPIFMGVIILADKVILYVFNPEYMSSKNLFMASLGFCMVYQFFYVYSAIIYALEKKRLFLISAMTALLNLAGDIILIPAYGVLGAILATGGSAIVLIVVSHIELRKSVKISYPWSSFLKFSLNVSAACAVLILARGFIKDAFSLISAAALSCLVYMVVSYFNRGFEDRDRELINRGLGRKIWVF